MPSAHAADSARFPMNDAVLREDFTWRTTRADSVGAAFARSFRSDCLDQTVMTPFIHHSRYLITDGATQLRLSSSWSHT